MEIFVPLVLFAIVASITPGPNNIMLLTSGVNFGLKRTIPHAIGISVGFFLLLLAIGMGIESLLRVFPNISLVLKIVGSGYLLYLSYRIAFSRIIGGYDQHQRQEQGQPLTCMESALFQWVNPKAWTMAVSAMTVYGTTEYGVNDYFFNTTIFVAIVFTVVNWPCALIWTLFGESLRRYLNTSNRLKWFNIGIGIILALSIIPILIIDL